MPIPDKNPDLVKLPDLSVVGVVVCCSILFELKC